MDFNFYDCIKFWIQNLFYINCEMFYGRLLEMNGFDGCK